MARSPHLCTLLANWNRDGNFAACSDAAAIHLGQHVRTQLSKTEDSSHGSIARSIQTRQLALSPACNESLAPALCFQTYVGV